MSELEYLTLAIMLVSAVFAVIVWYRVSSRIYREGYLPEREDLKRGAIQIGLLSLVTGFSGGLFAMLVNNPPVPTGSAQTPSVDWPTVLVFTFVWPIIMIGVFFLSIFFDPHRPGRW